MKLRDLTAKLPIGSQPVTAGTANSPQPAQHRLQNPPLSGGFRHLGELENTRPPHQQQLVIDYFSLKSHGLNDNP
jgi:hypothetical protein